MWNPASGLLQIGRELKNGNYITVSQHEVVLFLLSSLVTGSSFMSISSLVLVLRQFSFKGLSRNPEIGNTLICVLPSLIVGDWGNKEYQIWHKYL